VNNDAPHSQTSNAEQSEKPGRSSSTLSRNLALVAELEELLSIVEPASVANILLQRAFDHGATDIHLDPTTLGTRIRFRVDGVLQDILPIPAEKASILMSRIRVMAGMDITDRRLPRDGAIPAEKFPGLPRDIRVGSSLTVKGERLVLRLMPDSENLSSLSSLGFYDDQFAAVRRLLAAPYGLFLVVGPVGSGKSTTVFSMLGALNSPQKSVVTIEDPVERRIPGANQIQVDIKTGLTFVTALRGTLRQDPDIMAIGEIRDAETAQIACRAATSGVLVLSTLHANNTAGAVDVLRGFGISSAAIADCLRGVISQRLVRKVCEVSRQEIDADEHARRLLRVTTPEPIRIVTGIPTDQNFRTGYSGRTAVFEIMELNRPLQDAIHRGEPSFEIRQQAINTGMVTLEDSTRRKVFDKVTSIAELERVISDTEQSLSVRAADGEHTNE
jgi:type II secretory ATPase GspE/PulE/Tfp pilus assembly ATPase PilB-like protein